MTPRSLKVTRTRGTPIGRGGSNLQGGRILGIQPKLLGLWSGMTPVPQTLLRTPRTGNFGQRFGGKPTDGQPSHK